MPLMPYTAAAAALASATSTSSRSLQECVVQQPVLCQRPPSEAAAVIWTMERSLRASVVWLGPDLCSELLMKHEHHTIQQHLTGEQLMPAHMLQVM